MGLSSICHMYNHKFWIHNNNPLQFIHYSHLLTFYFLQQNELTIRLLISFYQILFLFHLLSKNTTILLNYELLHVLKKFWNLLYFSHHLHHLFVKIFIYLYKISYQLSNMINHIVWTITIKEFFHLLKL